MTNLILITKLWYMDSPNVITQVNNGSYQTIDSVNKTWPPVAVWTKDIAEWEQCKRQHFKAPTQSICACAGKYGPLFCSLIAAWQELQRRLASCYVLFVAAEVNQVQLMFTLYHFKDSSTFKIMFFIKCYDIWMTPNQTMMTKVWKIAVASIVWS